MEEIIKKSVENSELSPLIFFSKIPFLVSLICKKNCNFYLYTYIQNVIEFIKIVRLIP